MRRHKVSVNDPFPEFLNLSYEASPDTILTKCSNNACFFSIIAYPANGTLDNIAHHFLPLGPSNYTAGLAKLTSIPLSLQPVALLTRHCPLFNEEQTAGI